MEYAPASDRHSPVTMTDILFLLLFLLAVAVFLQVDFVFYIIYVLAGSYMLARWWTGRNLGRLQVSRRFTDHIFLGETAEVCIEVRNTSWWPVPWLRIQETPPLTLTTGAAVQQVIALRPRERTELHYDLFGRQRGYYEIGPALLTTGDLFGFSEERGQVEALDHLTVYPRVISLTHVDLVSRSPYGVIKSQQPIFADPARVMGKRPYQRGDPLRTIDWKSSAHADVLQVKKFEPAVSLTSLIFLDLNANAYTPQLRYNASEWAVTVAASLANYLTDQRQAVGLGCNGLDPLSRMTHWTIPPRLGRIHLMKLLEWLARVQVADATSLADWLPTAALDLSWGTTVIAVSPTGDEDTCRALHRLLRAGLNPVLVVVEPHGQFSIIRERAWRLGFPAHLVADERDLRRWGAARRPAAAPGRRAAA
jgi:uncharacterized protein (DUF58 family)